MVSFIPVKTRRWTNSRYQLPNILSKGEVWNFQRGKLCSLFMVNAEKRGAKIKKWGDANLLLPNVYVWPALPSHFSFFSVIEILYHEHPFAFSLAMSVMP